MLVQFTFKIEHGVKTTISVLDTTVFSQQQQSFWELAVKPFAGIEFFPLSAVSLIVETGFVISKYPATILNVGRPISFKPLEEISLNGFVVTAALRYNLHFR